MANDSASRIRQLQSEAQALLGEEVEDVRVDKPRSRGWDFVRFWIMVFQAFVRNRCPVRASSLAYTTLLSLVPVLAVAVGISTSMIKSRGEEGVRVLITSIVTRVAPQLDLWPGNEDVEARAGRQRVIDEVSRYISNLHSSTLTGTGALALIVVAISLLSTIEATFNDIWGVARGRNWISRVVHYWAAVTLGPLALVTALGLTTSSQLQATQEFLMRLPGLGPLLPEIMAFAAPLVVLSLAFALAYQLMPNTRVQWQAALIGGLVGGVLWQLNSYFNVVYMSRVVAYSKIYGSLGVVPVFLIGLYFSWLILLFGAQVAYAYQNRQAYWQERLAGGVNERGREFVALRLMTALAERFQQGRGPAKLMELTTLLGVPSRLAGQLLHSLARAGLVMEVAGPEAAYTPGRPLDSITVIDVVRCIRSGQGDDLMSRADAASDLLTLEFRRMEQAEHQVGGAITLAQLTRGSLTETGGIAGMESSKLAERRTS
jgi:membrane protein